MTDFIKNKIDVFDEIVNIYDKEVKDNLDHEAKELVKRLSRVLNTHAKNYGLETKNDVYPIKYYSLKYRIKGANSLKEKLIRKNEGFNLIHISNVSLPNDVETNKASVISQLYKMPDIIGVRIVTELRVDCNRTLSLLRSFVDDLANIDIVLDKLDLESQPQKMKNGLYIFKIKGIFRSDFGFELQIKSKIEEAWGDMDHAIFYKDYSVTPIKNVTQVTMNNVGKLLDNIDELLLGLRNSDNEYQENLEQLASLRELNEELFPLVEKKLGISFEIGKVGSFLTSVKEKAFEDVEIHLHLTTLDCFFLEFTVTDTRLKFYKTIRDKSFELLVIEVAYFNWCILNNKISLTQENYEDNLKNYLDILSNHIFDAIEKENAAQAAELIDSARLSQKITLYSKYLLNHDIYLSEKTIIFISKIEGIIEEFFQEKQDIYFDEDHEYSEFKIAFKILYVIKSLEFDDTNALSDLIVKFEEIKDIVNFQLGSIAYDFKEYQRKNEKNTRADLKKGEIVKESIPTIEICESVVNKLKLI